MIITISGIPGSGKTTVANILAERLGLKHYYMGAIRRDIAKQKGITLNELNRLAENDPASDKHVDDYLVNLGKTEDDFIAEGRTASHFIPDSIKIFIAVDPKVGAKRIMKDSAENIDARNETVGKDVQEMVDLLNERVECDKRRYAKYYNIDIFDRNMYDFWIDTSNMTLDQVVKAVMDFLKDK
ncbi:cytidylate kinase family protein [Candidatus Woesearchaeota archaeon]|nr:cytidylate kinase family protein [Candidatus Woesearchaeota archaeon]